MTRGAAADDGCCVPRFFQVAAMWYLMQEILNRSHSVQGAVVTIWTPQRFDRIKRLFLLCNTQNCTSLNSIHVLNDSIIIIRCIKISKGNIGGAATHRT